MLAKVSLLFLLCAHFQSSYSFALMPKFPGHYMRHHSQTLGSVKRTIGSTKIYCQDRIPEAASVEIVDTQYVYPKASATMELDDSDSILVAKLRMRIQESVLMEDYVEAANLQQELKDILHKAAKDHFDAPEPASSVSTLVSSKVSVPAVVRSLSAPKSLVLTDEERVRLDESSDALFWGKPRMAIHNDMQFAFRLEKLYRERLPAGSSVLDLGASCANFLPDIPLARVVGVGMNLQEMEANEALTERIVLDLNACCSLPFADESFDAVICSSTFHYFRNPEAVLSEVRRILRPSGVAIISFTDRFFDSKTIFAWRSRGTLARCDLVAECISAAGGMTPPQRFLEMSPLTPVSHIVPQARGLCGGDPFAALVSYKGTPPPGWAVRLQDDAHIQVPLLGSVPPLKITPFATVFLLYVILNHH